MELTETETETETKSKTETERIEKMRNKGPNIPEIQCGSSHDKANS